eukprot:CAMPEP_0117445894 /NCGR_PEP_ID=MMETSP0759-20121206/6044_1 /TAXON_ID=63605 /ORGANISM="Percolomonas cosmopolitus, Strain WS" /LENGTH=677 /DNA_ID=CAMNT_0005238111 /DNA_START=139 /DNA_END=2170 /DNA_ORIENTATION=-
MTDTPESPSNIEQTDSASLLQHNQQPVDSTMQEAQESFSGHSGISDIDEMPRRQLPVPQAATNEPHPQTSETLDEDQIFESRAQSANEGADSLDRSRSDSNGKETAESSSEAHQNGDEQILPLGAGFRIPKLKMPKVESEDDEEKSEEMGAPLAETSHQLSVENVTSTSTANKVGQDSLTEDQINDEPDTPRSSNSNGVASSNETIQIQVNQLEQLIESKMNRLKEDLLKQMQDKNNTTTVTHLKQKTIRVQLSPNHRRVSKHNVVPANLDPSTGKKKTPERFDASPRGVHFSSRGERRTHFDPHHKDNHSHEGASATITTTAKNTHNHGDELSSSDDDSEDLSPRIREEKTKFEAIFEEAIQRCYDRLRDVLGLNPVQAADEWKTSDETKWLRELYSYLKEENIHLRDALTIREGQIKLLQNSIRNLSNENKEGLKTIQDLKRKLGFQNRLLKKQIQQVEIERNHSPEVLIPALVQKMRNLDASPRRSLVTTRNTTPQNTPTTPTGSAHAYSVMQQRLLSSSAGSQDFSRDSLSPPSRSSLDHGRESPKTSPYSLHKLPSHETQLVPRIPSARRVKNSPRLSARGTNPPPDTLTRNEKKQMDKLAGRLMRSLRGPTTIVEEAQRVDAKVEDIQREFESRGKTLPLTRMGDCVYQLGRRKLNLYLSGNQLNVKSGGG